MGEGEGDHLEGFVLRIAAIAEQSSNHPLSRAILEVSSSIYLSIYPSIYSPLNLFFSLQAASERSFVLETLSEDSTVYHIGTHDDDEEGGDDHGDHDHGDDDDVVDDDDGDDNDDNDMIIWMYCSID